MGNATCWFPIYLDDLISNLLYAFINNKTKPKKKTTTTKQAIIESKLHISSLAYLSEQVKLITATVCQQRNIHYQSQANTHTPSHSVAARRNDLLLKMTEHLRVKRVNMSLCLNKTRVDNLIHPWTSLACRRESAEPKTDSLAASFMLSPLDCFPSDPNINLR